MPTNLFCRHIFYLHTFLFNLKLIKMIKKILLGSLLSIAGLTQAQNVGIGTNTPAPSAKLEIQSTDRGLLIPRINIPNLSAAAPVTAPATSLLVYNTNGTTGLGYYYWDGTQWVKLLSEGDSDHDWYEVGTTTAPDNINDNIFTQGNVGIGTNIPDQRLEISGGGMQINGLGGVGFQSELPVSGTATRDGYRIYYDNNLFGSAFDGVVFEKTDFNAPTPDGGIAFANMGNTNIREIAMVIRGNNRVGIGTTAPNNILQLGTPGAAADAFQDGLFINDTDGPIIRMRSLGSSEFFIENPAIASSNRLYFRPGNLTNNPTMALVANDVGIGTTAPAGQLHILNAGGSHYFDGQLFRTTRLITGQQYGLQFQHDAARTYFNTINNSGTPTTQMVIQSINGFIGMGTNVPTEKLDVVGSARIREIDLGTAATDTILVADITGRVKKKDANSLGLVSQTETEWRDAGTYIIARDAETAGNNVVVTDNGWIGVGYNTPIHPISLRDFAGGASLNFNNNSPTPVGWGMRINGFNTHVESNGGMLFEVNGDNNVGTEPFVFRGNARQDTFMLINEDNGNVGIGTATPSTRFHVLQNTTMNSFPIGATITAAVARIQQAGNISLYMDGNAIVSDANTSLSIGTINNGDVLFGTNDVTRMSVKGTTGNVGVGTTNPTVGRLQVRQSADNSNSGMTVTNVASTTGLRMWVDATNKGRIDASAGGGADLIINSTGSGDVGIGTETPTSKLHVENGNILNRSNTFTIHEARSHSNNLSQGPHFIGTRGGGTLAAPTHPANDAVILTMQGRNALNSGAVGSGITIRSSENHSATNQGSDIFFATVNNGATAASNRMVIQNDGKIGVGIMDSDARLHVASGGNGLVDYTAKFVSSPSVAGAGGIVFTNTESAVANGFKMHTTGTGGASHIGNNFVLSSIGVNSGVVNQDNILNIRGDGRMGWGVASSPSFYVNTSTGARLSNGGAWTNSSDRRLKTNIINSKYGLSTILSLRPVDYTMIKSEEKQVGFIAQEVQKIVPEAVYGTEGDMDKNETLSLSYDQLVPVLTKAIQEQQEMIEKQNKAIELLKKQVENLQNGNK